MLVVTRIIACRKQHGNIEMYTSRKCLWEKALVPQILHVCEWCDCNTKNPVGGRRVFSLIASLRVYAIPTYELRSTPAFGRRRRLPPAAAAMLVINVNHITKYSFLLSHSQASLKAELVGICLLKSARLSI